jgi:hypothetical protein
MWPAVVLSLVLAADEPRWVPVGNAAGVHWYTRARPGSEVNEIKVTALLDATPDEAWAVLADIEGWVETMPSTAAAEVLQRDEAGRALVYLRYVLPLISPRDTLIELTAQQGAQAWVIAWRAAAPERDVERPVAPGTVRLRVNEGEWRLEPREGGAKTFLIYRLLSAPGGSVPPFFVNRVNTLGVPQTIDSLRKAIVARRKR